MKNLNSIISGLDNLIPNADKEDALPVMKALLTFLRNDLETIAQTMKADKERLESELALALSDEPVYALHWSRDCDCYESTTRHAYSNGKEYLQDVSRSYEDAEGPQAWTIVTKEYYDAFEESHRDLAMEAHENGHDHVVYSSGPAF